MILWYICDMIMMYFEVENDWDHDIEIMLSHNPNKRGTIFFKTLFGWLFILKSHIYQTLKKHTFFFEVKETHLHQTVSRRDEV